MRGLPVSPLVLIDGIEVNNPKSGSVFNFGNLPTVAISCIEVLRGAQSSLYGGNALTGVISVNTQKPNKNEQFLKLGASYGSHNTVSGYISATGDNDWMNYSLIATKYETDGFSAQPEEFGEEWADDDAHEVNSLHSRLGFTITENLKANFIVHYHDTEAEYDPGTPSQWGKAILDNYTTQEQLLAKAETCLNISEMWDVCASYTVNKLDDFNHNAYGAKKGESELNKIDLINNFKFAEAYVSLLGAEIEEAKDKRGNNSYKTKSIFTEHVLDIQEHVTFTAGARYDDNSVFGDEKSWRSSLAYNITECGLKLRGSYRTGFDAPEISQLFGSYGNPDLKAETGSSYDLGVEWNSKNKTVSLGATTSL